MVSISKSQAQKETLNKQKWFPLVLSPVPRPIHSTPAERLWAGVLFHKTCQADNPIVLVLAGLLGNQHT